jgi:glucose-6-phosphate 1-dehydrogenase
MVTVATNSIDEDILQDVWDEERSWREEHSAKEPPPEPFTLVIFGATGDLTHRKLIPALYHLARSDLLPEKFAILGFGRSRQEQEEFRDGLRNALVQTGVRLDEEEWNVFARRISYFRGTYGDAGSFVSLRERLDEVDRQTGTGGRRLFYLATPPAIYMDVVRNLGSSGLNRSPDPHGWVKVIVEKPFGHDLSTARVLDECVHETFDESQVYRIDHYLGKETVQNIFVLRFVNGIFEPIWNRNFVDHVQITVAESLGVEARGTYYEGAGALRDMLQSHLLQLLTLTAMEPPSTFTADKVRDEKVKVLDSVRFPGGDCSDWLVRGQYARGTIEGKLVPGYRDEKEVAPNSNVETFFGLKLLVDNWRWGGVPFYLRAGKRLAKRVSEIAIEFRRAPHMFLPGNASSKPRRNVLVLRIQPDDGMALRLDVKVPGPSMRVRPVDMSFLYKEAFGGISPDAYERLLLDAMRGDSTLFARTDEVEAAWSLVTPLLDALQGRGDLPPFYPAGSWGPEEADALMERGGHRWRRP